MNSQSDHDLVRVVLLNELDNSSNQASIRPTSVSEDPFSSNSSLVYLLEALAEAIWKEEEEEAAKTEAQLSSLESQLELDPEQIKRLVDLLNQDESALDLLGRRILSLQGRDESLLQRSSKRVSDDFHLIQGWSNPIPSGSNVLVEDQIPSRDQVARSLVALQEGALGADDEQDELEELFFHLPSISFVTTDQEESQSRNRSLESSIDYELDWLADELTRAREEEGIWIMEIEGLFGEDDGESVFQVALSNPGIEALKYDVYEPSPAGSPKRDVEETGEEERPRKTVRMNVVQRINL